MDGGNIFLVDKSFSFVFKILLFIYNREKITPFKKKKKNSLKNRGKKIYCSIYLFYSLSIKYLCSNNQESILQRTWLLAQLEHSPPNSNGTVSLVSRSHPSCNIFHLDLFVLFPSYNRLNFTFSITLPKKKKKKIIALQ